MNIKFIANRLVELCRAGKFEQAQEELYASDVVSIEPERLPPDALGNAKGQPAILEKGRQFRAAIETMHGSSVSEPVVAGYWFSVAMMLDLTLKGRGRTKLEEICIFHVRDGKIVQEQFFYDRLIPPACSRSSFKLGCECALKSSRAVVQTGSQMRLNYGSC
jgi:hypothetical protein